MNADATSWVTLGHTMLELALDQPRAASRADVAFRTAERLDPEQSGAIQAARDAVERLRLERRAAEAAASEARLRTADPEAQQWPATPMLAVTSSRPANKSKAA